MERKHSVVIIPGLGDDEKLYRSLTSNWEAEHGLTPYIHVMGWRTKGSDFNERLTSLKSSISSLLSDKQKVSVIGISAGASAAMNATADLKSSGQVVNGRVVLVCGRFNFDSHSWHPLNKNLESLPGYKESLERAQPVIEGLSEEDKKNMYIFRSSLDEVIPSSATSLPGVATTVYPIPTHSLGILGVFLFKRKLIDVLKSV